MSKKAQRKAPKRRWRSGPVEWIDGRTAYLSVVFTWHVAKAWQRAVWLTEAGYNVRVGGPGVHVRTEAREALRKIARVGGTVPDAVVRHNPQATFASRGCDVGCSFCIVPSLEGRTYTLIPNFPVRPVLCDNNLSGLPAEYQDHIVSRYKETGVRLVDANSGFEPRTFDEEVYHRWEPINCGPWRFALDDQGDLPHVIRVLQMLREKVARPDLKRVYVLIGNEPFESCMERILLVLDRGAEPHVQWEMKLNAPVKEPWVKDGLDWSDQLLRDVARWANRRIWRKNTFAEYRRGYKNRVDVSDLQMQLAFAESEGAENGIV